MEYKLRRDLNHIEKIYWFLRYFVETDKAALGKNIKKVSSIAETLGATIASTQSLETKEKLNILFGVLTDSILDGVKEESQVQAKLFSLIADLSELLESENDYKSLIFCLNNILTPSNQALEIVPTKEATEIAKIYAKNLLDEKGTKGLGNILTQWDSITLDICLNRERDICSKLFFDIRKKLETKQEFFFKETEDNPTNSDVILSALGQEFERRLGQKRKQRSGQDLEDATTYIFSYYDIPCAESPSHFTAAIEVDNWIKDSKGWYIGFSLKRTLRERWKQTVVDKDTLTEFRVRHIIHLICNDGDLSDQKIGDMGAKRHLFFVPDSSSVLTRVNNDNVLSDYVKPMSQLIDFIQKSRKS
ncbi:MAG: hypothetical protein K6L80_15320 [Agarilytica sp.]